MNKEKTPRILWEASRQYRHNNSDGLVYGFDRDITCKIVNSLQRKINKFERYLDTFKLDVCQGDCVDEIYGLCKEYDKCGQYNRFQEPK